MIYQCKLPPSGLHLTGMYLHPAMATGHTFGCGPTPILSHILVYWGGPFIGIYIGLKVSILPIQTTVKNGYREPADN